MADRGYDADWIRSTNGSRGRTSRPNAIAKTQSSSAPTFTATEPGRERFFDKIKQCRRVATRYDKLAANYLAFVKLACIRPWLRFDNRCQFHSAPKRVLVFPAHESPQLSLVHTG